MLHLISSPFVFHWVPRYLIYATGNLFRNSIGSLLLGVSSETEDRGSPHHTAREKIMYIHPWNRQATELEREIIDVITKFVRITMGTKIRYNVQYNLDVIREGPKG